MLQKKIIASGLNGNIGRKLRELDNTGIEFFNIDNNATADCFLHLAGKSNNNSQDLVSSNILYLLKIIEYCQKNKIKDFIFLSAISIYGNINKENVDETVCNNIINLYSTTKLLAEKILQESHLNVLVIRVPMVLTTDRKNGVLNHVMNKLEADEDITLHNANKLFNNFISVNDIYSFITNYTFDKKYEIVNLASKQTNTLLEIVSYLHMKIKSKSKILVHNEKYPFFNISIDKACSLYNYQPQENKKKLARWIEERKKSTSSNLLNT